MGAKETFADWIVDRIIGLYRSRTIRLVAYVVLLAVAGHVLGASAFLKPVFGQVDPILYQSAAFKLTFAIVAVVAVQNILPAFDNRAGLTWSKDWMPLLKSGNVAVAVYLGARFVGTCILMGWALG